jgi:hypothetical protein
MMMREQAGSNESAYRLANSRIESSVQPLLV